MSKTSEFIRIKREALGLTPAELAQKVGVFESEVKMWERGLLPDSKYLLKLAETLQVETDEILRGEDEAPASGDSAAGSSQKDVQSSGQYFARGLSPDLKTDVVKDGAEELQTDSSAKAHGNIKAEKSENAPEAENAENAIETENSEKVPEAENAENVIETENSENASEAEKSAYMAEEESLQEQSNERESIDADDPLADEDFLFDEPLMRNGFTKRERVLGYVAGAVFIFIVLLNIISSIVGYVGRDRTLTIENYKNYIEIDSEPVGNVNVDTVEITVKFKEHVTDFKLSITVTLSAMLGSNDYVTDISFSKKDCEAGAVLSRQITFEYYEYSPFARIKVNSVSGGLD